MFFFQMRAEKGMEGEEISSVSNFLGTYGQISIVVLLLFPVPLGIDGIISKMETAFILPASSVAKYKLQFIRLLLLDCIMHMSTGRL